MSSHCLGVEIPVRGRLPRFCHLDDFLVDAAGTVTGFGEVGGVGKGLAEGSRAWVISL